MSTHADVQTAVNAAIKAAKSDLVATFVVNPEVASRGRVQLPSTDPQYKFHEIAYDLAAEDTAETVAAHPLLTRLLGK